MKRRCIVLVTVFLLLLLVSCRQASTYSFLNSTQKIEAISIVRLTFDDNGDLSENEIKIIENCSEFIDDFQKMNCYNYLGDPFGAIPENEKSDTVIKILYDGGEYEFINWCEQSKYTVDYGFKYYMGFKVFDEHQFKGLVDKMLRLD